MVWTVLGALGLLLLVLAAYLAFGVAAAVAVAGVCCVGAAVDGRSG